MKKIYIFYFIIILCAFSCLEDVNMPGERQNVDFPILTITEKPDTITSNSVTLSADIESANGYEITARGFIYALDASMKEGRDSISTPFETEGELGLFKFEIKELSPQTKYYYMAFATNKKGTQYSKVLNFITWPEIPILETGEPKDINNGNAVIPGIITSIGEAPIEEYGICYSLTSLTPVYEVDNTDSVPVKGNNFEVHLSKLAGGKTYNVRAYARNSYGIAYGETKFLKTPEIWERVADFGEIDGIPVGKGRIAYTKFTISNYFYVAAGEDANSYFLDDVWEYNPNTDVWSRKANILGFRPRKAPSSFVIGNRGYTGFGISGNESNLSDIYTYQQSKNEWNNIEKAFPGMAREYACSFSLNNSGYIVGGRVTDENRNNTTLSDVWRYEFSGNTWGWHSMSDFPIPIQEGLSFSYQNKAFIGLGVIQLPIGADTVSYYDKIWMYNQGSNLWTIVSTVPADFNYKGKPEDSIKGGVTGVTVVENNAYIIDRNNQIWSFNLDSYEWSKKSEMPIPSSYSDNQCMFSYKNESKNEYEIFVGLNRLSKYFYKYRPSWDNPVK